MTGDTVPLSTYALHAVGSVAFTVGFILAVGYGWHRYVIRRLDEHFDRANGEVRAFADEIDRWDAEQTTLARRVR